MKKVSVGVLTSLHPAFDIRIFHRECKTLARAGYDVTLIAPHGNDLECDGIKIKAVAKSLHRGRLTRGAQMMWRVYRSAIQLSADIYHFHDPELIPIGLLLRLQGKKVIYDAHEDLPADLRSREGSFFPDWSRVYVAWFIKLIEEFSSRWVTAIVTAGEDITARLNFFNRNVVTVENFPLLEEFVSIPCPVERYRSHRIVSFGGMSEARSIGEQIEALGQLPDELTIRLVIGGRPAEPKLLERLKTLKGWKRVDDLGQAARPEMIGALAQASAALILFKPGPNHYAIRSNRLYESLAAGLPVIVPNFEAWKALVEEAGCGICVNPLDPVAIAEAMSFLCTHSEEAALMGARGRKLVLEKFNWRKEETKLVSLYGRLAQA